MYEIDRMVAVVKPTQLFVSWVNSHADEEEDEVSLEDLQDDATALLIPMFEDFIEIDQYIQSIFDRVFISELESWQIKKDKWPENRTYSMFKEWFDVEMHSFVVDTATTNYPEDDIERTGSGTGTLQ